MTSNLEQIKQHAKSSYETGRLNHALKFVLFVIPLIALSVSLCANPLTPLYIGLILSIVLVGLIWKGLEFGRGAKLGLISGAVAYLLPIGMHITGYCCSLNIEAFICFASGALAGLITASRVHTVSLEKLNRFLVSAALVAGLTASLGCAYLGISGALGVLSGVFMVTLSVLVYSRTAS